MKTAVMVAVPMGDFQMRGELHTFVTRLVYRQFLEKDFPYLFQHETVMGYHPVQAARNELVKRFLKSDCQILWFLDADNMPYQGAEKVLEGPYDVTIGPVPMLIVSGSGNPVVTYNLFTSIDDSNVGVMWQPGNVVRAGGTANMAIKRTVLEDRRLWIDEDGSVFKREYGSDGFPLYGEDVDFCRRAGDLGFSIGANEDALCDHAKTFGLNYYQGVLLRQMEAAQKDKG